MAILTLAVVILFGTVMFFQPRWMLRLISEIFPGPVYFVETNAPIAALTIDDGPDPLTTPKILEVLFRHRAKATFFLISGQVPGNEAIISAIVEQGHELGNHLTRNETSIKLTAAGFEAALLEADTVLSRFAEVRWVRPGSGWYNSEMIKIIHSHNYRCALGSVFPYDVQIPWSWFTTHHLLLNIHPGAILILHDTGLLGERTASVLDTVLPELHRRGYRIVSLSELVNQRLGVRGF